MYMNEVLMYRALRSSKYRYDTMKVRTRAASLLYLQSLKKHVHVIMPKPNIAKRIAAVMADGLPF